MGKESQNLSKYESAKAFLESLKNKNGVSVETLESLGKIIENKMVLSTEQKSSLGDFFEKTDDATAKTEGWKNLYQVYLENQISDKRRQVDEWAKEKKALEDRMKTLKANANLSELDTDLRIAEREEAVVMSEVESAKQAYEEKTKEHLEKGWKLHKGINYTTAYLKQLIYEGEKKLYVIPSVINMLDSNADLFDAQTDEVLNIRKGLREYNMASGSIKSDRKNRETIITNGIKNGKTIPELKEHAQNIEHQFKCEQALNKFMDTLRLVSDDERGPFPSDKTLELFHKAGKEAFKSIGEDTIKRLGGGQVPAWEKLSINQFESLLQGYIEKAGEQISASREEAQKHEKYEEVFKTRELKEVEEKIERYEQLKKEYPDYTVEEIKEAVKYANQARNQYLQDNMESFKEAGISNKIRIVSDTNAVTASESELYKTQYIVDMLEREFEETETKLFSQKSEYEIRELESKYTRLRSEAQKDERVILANQLRTQKAELGNIKQETLSLKEKIKPEVVSESIKEKAEMLLEQKAFRKGSHSDSKEYKAMIAALTIVKDWGNPDSPIADQKNSQKVPKTFGEALELLQSTSEKYLKAKAAQIRLSPSALRQSRLSFAESIKAFAADSIRTCDNLAPKVNNQELVAGKSEISKQNNEPKMEGQKSLV